MPRCSQARGHRLRLLRDGVGGRRQLALRQRQRRVARRTARCTSTPRARRWSTPRTRCRTSYPDYPNHWQIAAYFDDFVDHFGLRERITFRTEVTRVEPADGRRLGRDDPPRATTAGRRDPALRPRPGRQRAPLGPALARAVVPRQRDVPGRADPRPLLPRRPTSLDGQAGAWCSGSATPPPTSRSSRSRIARETYLAMRRGALGPAQVPVRACRPTTSTDSPLARGSAAAAEARHAHDAADRGRAR